MIPVVTPRGSAQIADGDMSSVLVHFKAVAGNSDVFRFILVPDYSDTKQSSAVGKQSCVKTSFAFSLFLRLYLYPQEIVFG